MYVVNSTQNYCDLRRIIRTIYKSLYLISVINVYCIVVIFKYFHLMNDADNIKY